MSRRIKNEVNKSRIEFPLANDSDPNQPFELPDYSYNPSRGRKHGRILHHVGNLSLGPQLKIGKHAGKPSKAHRSMHLNQNFNQTAAPLDSGNNNFDFLTGLGLPESERNPMDSQLNLNGSFSPDRDELDLAPASARFRKLDGCFGVPAVEYEKKGLLNFRLKLKQEAMQKIGYYPPRSQSAEGKQGIAKGAAHPRGNETKNFNELYEIIEDRERQDPELIKYEHILKQKKGNVFKGSFDPEKALEVLSGSLQMTIGPSKPRRPRNSGKSKRRPLPFSFHSIITKHSQMYPEGAKAIQKKYADQISLIKPRNNEALFGQSIPGLKS